MRIKGAAAKGGWARDPLIFWQRCYKRLDEVRSSAGVDRKHVAFFASDDDLWIMLLRQEIAWRYVFSSERAIDDRPYNCRVSDYEAYKTKQDPDPKWLASVFEGLAKEGFDCYSRGWDDDDDDDVPVTVTVPHWNRHPPNGGPRHTTAEDRKRLYELDQARMLELWKSDEHDYWRDWKPVAQVARRYKAKANQRAKRKGLTPEQYRTAPDVLEAVAKAVEAALPQYGIFERDVRLMVIEELSF
jgi:hypothetical protein